jgi:hypothetical protein
MRYPTASAGDAGALLRLAGRLSLEPFGPPAPRALARLVALALLVAMCVPPPLLSAMGVPYDAPTGSLLFKLHPATWLVGLALAVALVARGNPLRELGRSLAHQPATAAYLGALLAMIAWSLTRFGASGAAFLIDTLLVPGLVALLLTRLDLSTQKRLFTLVAVVLMGNAVLGIGEQILKVRLVPHTTFGGVELVEDVFRATGLFGHPLSNAAITGFGLFVLYQLRAPAARFACCLVAIAALLSFGGRTALGIGIALLAPLAMIDLARHVRRDGLSYREITGGTMLLVLALGAIVAAVAAGGIGERIMAKLAWDDSAQVREKSLLVLGVVDWPQLLFGMSPDEIARAAEEVGIRFPSEAIENFWVVLLLQVGALLLALFAVALVLFCARLARRGGTAVGLGLFGFLIVASTSNSLATKSEVFVVVILLAQLAAAYRCHGLLQDAGIGADPDGIVAAGWEAPWAGAALPARSG